jgi:predicted nicotinamide N-methyase
MKYGDKLKKLANADNESALSDERTFIRRKINESLSEIRQLENNLLFFSDTSGDNPLVKDVVYNIDRQKETLATWKAKLKNLNILQHNLNKEEIEEAEESEGSEEE